MKYLQSTLCRTADGAESLLPSKMNSRGSGCYSILKYLGILRSIKDWRERALTAHIILQHQLSIKNLILCSASLIIITSIHNDDNLQTSSIIAASEQYYPRPAPRWKPRASSLSPCPEGPCVEPWTQQRQWPRHSMLPSQPSSTSRPCLRVHATGPPSFACCSLRRLCRRPARLVDCAYDHPLVCCRYRASSSKPSGYCHLCRFDAMTLLQIEHSWPRNRVVVVLLGAG